WNTFGRGWSRRIAHMEAKGLSWVSSRPQLAQDAKDAQSKSTGQGGAAVGVGGAGTADQVAGVSGLPIGVIIAAVAIVAGVFIVRAVINGQRAKALKEVAKNA